LAADFFWDESSPPPDFDASLGLFPLRRKFEASLECGRFGKTMGWRPRTGMNSTVRYISQTTNPLKAVKASRASI
jgi:hypothetical protein